jgi:hypothetical protein
MQKQIYGDAATARIRLDVVTVEQSILLKYELYKIGEFSFSSGVTKRRIRWVHSRPLNLIWLHDGWKPSSGLQPWIEGTKN